jgi:hypothetical protein
MMSKIFLIGGLPKEDGVLPSGMEVRTRSTWIGQKPSGATRAFFTWGMKG